MNQKFNERKLELLIRSILNKKENLNSKNNIKEQITKAKQIGSDFVGRSLLPDFESDILKVRFANINLTRRDMRFVDRELVKCIQRALVKNGYSSVLGPYGPKGDGVDGIYGRNTIIALKDFQKKNNLKIQIGFFDKETSKLLGCQPLDYRQIEHLIKNKKTNTNKTETSEPTTSLTKHPNVSSIHKINYEKTLPLIKTNSSVNLTKTLPPGTDQCAQFVNDFSDDFKAVGNAWDALRGNGQIGKTKFSIYDNVPDDVYNSALKIFNSLYRQGKPIKGVDTEIGREIKNLNRKLLSKKPSATDFKVGDVVGIYNPKSEFHEVAFSGAGQSYFVCGGRRSRCIKKPDKPSGQLWGANTHVGIVGAIKNGVPIIYHNVHGTVYADPYNNLNTAWIKGKT